MGETVVGPKIGNADAGHRHLQSHGLELGVDGSELVGDGTVEEGVFAVPVDFEFEITFSVLLGVEEDISIKGTELGIGWLEAS